MKRIAVIGAGRMGASMAQVLALAGFAVDLADLKERGPAEHEGLFNRVKLQWESNLRLLSEVGDAVPDPVELGRRITFRTGYGPWLGSVEFLFEALPEQAGLKRAVYRRLGDWIRPECVVGSTTSSLTPDVLEGALPHPERFMITHWLYPAWIMPLVEVARGSATAADALEGMLKILRTAGKVPVLLSGRPGLVVPRLQVMIMNEAARLVAEGVGTAGEIDRAVQLGLGIRFFVLGLLEFADHTGIDTLYHVSRSLRDALGDSKYTPAPPVADRMRRGELGTKTGVGFYDWRAPGGAPQEEGALRTYLRLVRFLEGQTKEPPPPQG